MGSGSSSHVPSDERTIRRDSAMPVPVRVPSLATMPIRRQSEVAPADARNKAQRCRWVFCDAGSEALNPTEWCSFPASASERLEEAFLADKDECQIVVAKRLYTVDFRDMTQKSSVTTRRVQRVPILESRGTGNTPPPESSTSGVRNGGSSGRFDSPSVESRSMVDPFALDPLTSASFDVGGSTTQGGATPAAVLHSSIQAHNSSVYGIMFSPAGDTIITGSKDGSVKYWEIATSFLVTEFDLHPGSVLSAALSKSSMLAATGCDDCIARLFHVNSPHAKAELEGHEHKVYAVNFTSDGKTLVTISMDCDMRTWDVGSARCTRVVAAHSSSIFNMQTSPNTNWLVITAGDDCILASHDLRLKHTVTARYTGHEKTLWGCDIRYDDGQFLSCGMDSRVNVWDPRIPNRPLVEIQTHKTPVHCVEYMPDGNTFLSSSRDKSFKMTSAATGENLFTVQAHDGHVFKVTYCAANRLAMTCGSDALVKLWQLT